MICRLGESKGEEMFTGFAFALVIKTTFSPYKLGKLP